MKLDDFIHNYILIVFVSAGKPYSMHCECFFAQGKHYMIVSGPPVDTHKKDFEVPSRFIYFVGLLHLHSKISDLFNVCF